MSKYDGYSLEKLNLTTRTYNALRRYGILYINDLLDLYKTDKEKIKRIRNIGEESFKEIESALQSYLDQEGVKLNDISLTDAEQQLYDDLTKLINDECYLGVADSIISKLDELVDEFLRRKKNETSSY